MAIAFDNSASAKSSSGALSITTSLTVGSGKDRILFASVTDFGGDTVTGVTYDGVAMTFINKLQNVTETVYMYYLVNPNSGANNLVATRTGTTSVIVVLGASYTGASQTGVPDVSTTDSISSDTTITTSLTTLTNNSWTVLGLNSQRALTASTGSTERENLTDAALADSGGPINPAALYSMSYTLASANRATSTMISFKPSTDNAIFFGNNF